eukprot:scaffold179_cov368-Prasinococcus_capsulatus_cf.AAC.43
MVPARRALAPSGISTNSPHQPMHIIAPRRLVAERAFWGPRIQLWRIPTPCNSTPALPLALVGLCAVVLWMLAYARERCARPYGCLTGVEWRRCRVRRPRP